MEFASTPENRRKYLGSDTASNSGKVSKNEKFLQSMCKKVDGGGLINSEDAKRLIGIIDTMCLMADSRCAKHEVYVKHMKELLENEDLHWLMEKLEVEICTCDHYDY